jgi:hypothetical protein
MIELRAGWACGLMFASSALLVPGAEAQVYKCVNAKGKAEYSQSPCPTGSKATVVAKPSEKSVDARRQSGGKGAPLTPATKFGKK